MRALDPTRRASWLTAVVLAATVGFTAGCAGGFEADPSLEDPEAEPVDPPGGDPFGDPDDPGEEPLEDEGDLDDRDLDDPEEPY